MIFSSFPFFVSVLQLCMGGHTAMTALLKFIEFTYLKNFLCTYKPSINRLSHVALVNF